MFGSLSVQTFSSNGLRKRHYLYLQRAACGARMTNQPSLLVSGGQAGDLGWVSVQSVWYAYMFICTLMTCPL